MTQTSFLHFVVAVVCARRLHNSLSYISMRITASLDSLTLINRRTVPLIPVSNTKG